MLRAPGPPKTRVMTQVLKTPADQSVARKAAAAVRATPKRPAAGRAVAAPGDGFSSTQPAPTGEPSLRLAVGSRGMKVGQLEAALKAGGFLSGKVGAVFDPRTAAAVRRFERGQGFTTVNLNIKNNPPLPHEQLMHDVRKAARGADLIGWNEISVPSYRKAIRALGPRWAHYMPGGGNQTPISWKKSEWKLLASGRKPTHPGMPGVSPSRNITWVKLKHRQTGETVVRMNTHLVAGAWSAKPQSHRAWRQEMWKRHIAKLKELVKHFSDRGATVVVGGDFNRNHYPVLGDRVVYGNGLKAGTHGGATLDYIMHVPGASIRKVKGGVRRGFASDHDAPVVRYQLKG